MPCRRRWPTRWQSTLISRSRTGIGGGNGSSNDASISADGTKIVFTSGARDFGIPDTNGLDDVFVHDTTTGTTTMVSVNRLGTNSANGTSSEPTISADGTKVVFASTATNLQSLPVSGTTNLYVRDLTTATTSLVTVNAAGTTGRGLWALFPVHDSFDVSADGTAVAWTSEASDLVTGIGGSGNVQVYVRDLVTATTTLGSVGASGNQYGNGFSLFPDLNGDGDGLTFSSTATNLAGSGASGTSADLYARDRVTSTTHRLATGPGLSLDARRVPATFDAGRTRVVFQSLRSDLGPTDSNGVADVYVADLASGTTTLVSTRPDGTNSGAGESTDPSFSPDGTEIVFTSTAPDLAGTDTNETTDVFVRDLIAGTTTLVSINAPSSDSGIAGSRTGVFTDDGRVLFESLAWDLGPHDTNNEWDLYLRDPATGLSSLVTNRSDGQDSPNGPSTSGAFGGGRVAFQSLAPDVSDTDPSPGSDVHLAAPYAIPSP